MKFIVYNSDFYYPFATEYPSVAEAVKAFRELQSSRMEEIRNKNSLFFSKDYLCIVIEEIDPVQLAKSDEVTIRSKDMHLEDDDKNPEEYEIL
jgi:hypothetical protein